MAAGSSGFKDPTRLTRWVRYLLYAQIAFAIAWVAISEADYRKIARIHVDWILKRYATDAEALAAATSGDPLWPGLMLADLLLFIVSGAVILAWVYRANYNARQLGANGMTFSPGWSVGYYFVPILSLWKPYQAMKEIWRASHQPAEWQNAKSSALLRVWWLFWIIWLYLTVQLNAMPTQVGDYAATHSTGIALTMLAVKARILGAQNLLFVVLSLVTLVLISAIYKAQMGHVRTGGP